jgi:hypothetical protein
MITIFDPLAILRFYGQNGQSKFDQDHPQDYKIFVVMTISTIPDIFCR